MIYEKYKLKDALSAICTILIRSHNMNTSAFGWYLAGIEEQLRITELPEYYMYSINEDIYETLNHSVLTYFAYNNKLPDKKKAYLYANIVSNKGKDVATYKVYENEIREYALQKLSSKSMKF